MLIELSQQLVIFLLNVVFLVSFIFDKFFVLLLDFSQLLYFGNGDVVEILFFLDEKLIEIVLCLLSGLFIGVVEFSGMLCLHLSEQILIVVLKIVFF